MTPYRHTVQYYETDKMGITHHSNYIRFMEEARVSFLSDIGFGYDKMERDGMVSPVVSIQCDYKRPTTFADEIDVFISVKEITRVKLTLSYEMKRGEEAVCLAQSSHCFLSKEGRPVSIQKSYPEFYNAMCDLIKK